MYNLIVNDYDRHVYETELKDFLPDEFCDFHTHICLTSFNAYGSHNGGSSWTDRIADELPPKRCSKRTGNYSQRKR